MIATRQPSVWPAIGLAILVGAGCSRDRAGSATDLSTYTVLLDAQDWTPSVARDRVSKFLVFLELATPNENGSLEGRLAKRAQYVKGKQEGETIEYYPNGQVREWAQYSNNKLEGDVLQYDDAGELLSKTTFHEGKPASPPEEEQGTTDSR